MAPRDATAPSEPNPGERPSPKSGSERRPARRAGRDPAPSGRLPPAAEKAERRKKGKKPGEPTVLARLSDPPRDVSPDASTRRAERKARAALAPDRKKAGLLPAAARPAVVVENEPGRRGDKKGDAGVPSAAKPATSRKKGAPKEETPGFHLTSRVEVLRRAAPWQRTLAADLLGLAHVALAILCGLSLVSYSPNDPGFTVARTGAIKNWVGPAGALIADGLTLLLGLLAFAMPILLLGAGFAFLRARVRAPRLRQLVGMLVFMAGSVTLLEVGLAGSDAFPFPPGGLIGVILSSMLLPVLFPVGTAVVGVAVAGGGLLVSLDRSLAHTLDVTWQLLRRTYKRAGERVAVYREQRRLLVEERDRLEAELQAEALALADLDDQSRVARRARVAEAAEALAREKLAAELGAEEEAPPVISTPATDDLGPAIAAPWEGEVPAGDLPATPDLAPFDDDRSVASLRRDGADPRWVGAGPELAELDLEKSVQLGAEAASSPPLELSSAALDDAALPPPPVGPDPEAPTSAGARRAAAPSSPKKAAEKPAAAEGLRIVERQDDDEPALLDEDPTIPDQAARQYELPPLKLLDYDAPERLPVDEEKMLAEAEKLVRKFKDFGIDGRVREVRPGPVVTTYEFVPAPGIKVSRIAALSDDIAMAMEAVHVRIVAPIPGKGAVGIEIPNERRETVYLKEIIATEKFRKADGALTMALGKDIEGKPYTADLGSMPHVLISGTTGSGKSVSVNAMICSLLYRATPEDVRFLMIDPKMLELSVYDGIPHLLLPPIIDSKKAANALQWAVGEMERRYQAMSEIGVRDIAGFNEVITSIRAGTDPQGRKPPTDEKGVAANKFPYIVIVVDEYADLLATAGKEVEGYVMRLAQKARAAGIHVMLATQRPSVDVITGVIKANFPVRMGFRLASSHDSKTIINRPGAEKLLGRGDMLIMPPGTSNVTRVHGAFISEKELHRVVEFLKSQGDPDYDMSIVATPKGEDGADSFGDDEEKDPKWDEAVTVVARSRRCSTSWLQRQLGIGYNRAARIVEMMEREGLVGPQINSKGDREIHLADPGG